MAPHPSLARLKKGLSNLKENFKKRRDALQERLNKQEKISPADEAWLDNDANQVDADAVVDKLENASDYERGLSRLDSAEIRVVLTTDHLIPKLAYRLSDWRAGIGAQGMKAVQTLFDTAQEDESESEAEEESTEQVPLDAQPSKPAKFSFETPEGIAAFVEWALQKHKESGTLAFYWQTWGDGKEKKGLFLSHLVAYTYAYHLTALAALPTKHMPSDAPAIGALLLAVQAVQRSLQFWKTGMLVIPCKNEGHFSIDNWGDISTQGSDGKIKKIRRATFFCATLATWDDGRWQQLCAAADEWVEKKKRAITSSRATSEAEDLVEEEEDVIIVSD
ncbi:hypothetical protein B0H10DRAFT_2227081 [Mycena sp. CBHHK59/15]|nr:hypothetical protein B0H10DRAFT_2227081 [Mycena sp. CBHHK59/15]